MPQPTLGAGLTQSFHNNADKIWGKKPDTCFFVPLCSSRSDNNPVHEDYCLDILYTVKPITLTLARNNVIPCVFPLNPPSVITATFLSLNASLGCDSKVLFSFCSSQRPISLPVSHTEQSLTRCKIALHTLCTYVPCAYSNYHSTLALLRMEQKCSGMQQN